MSPLFRKLLCAGWIGLVALASVRAQNTAAVPPELDFSKDPCGNPMMESQGWSSVEGTVSSVIDGRTILLALEDDHRPLRVHIAGIALERRDPFSEQPRTLLLEMLLNKPVEIMVNPSRWNFVDKRPETVTGVVHVSQGARDDVALSLLAQGLVRFKAPRPYTMSRYTMCQYRRAETEAHSKKLGLWQ
jgi:endonuclease YncB( thermonuclease family)